VRAVPCRDFFFGGRPEIIEAEVMPGDSGEQFSVWEGPIGARMFRGVVLMRIDGWPLRTPEWVDAVTRVQVQFTNVSAAFEDGNMAPARFQLVTGAAIQEVRNTAYRNVPGLRFFGHRLAGNSQTSWLWMNFVRTQAYHPPEILFCQRKLQTPRPSRRHGSRPGLKFSTISVACPESQPAWAHR
jgi:hypothetical protein